MAAPTSLAAGHARRFVVSAPALARRVGPAAAEHDLRAKLALAHGAGDSSAERSLSIELGALLEVGRFDLGGAAALYARAADIEPEVSVLLVLAALEERLGRSARAADALERALTLGDAPGGWLRLGWLRIRAGQVRDAVQVLVQASATSREPRVAEWLGALGFVPGAHASLADAAEAYIDAARRASLLPNLTTSYGTSLELQELGRAASLSRSVAVENAFTAALGRRDPALADAFAEAWAFAAPPAQRAEALANLTRARAARGDVEGQLVVALQPGGAVGSEGLSGLLLRAGLPALLAEQIALRARDAAGDERCRLLVERMRVLAGPVSDPVAAARASADVLAQAPAEPEALSRLEAYLASDQAGPGVLAALVERVGRAEGPLGPLAEVIAAAGARSRNPGFEVLGLRAALLGGETAKLRERLVAAEARCHASLAPPSGPVSAEWRRDRLRILGALPERRDEWAREVDAYLREGPWSPEVVEFAVDRALAAGESEQALRWARAGLDRAMGIQRSVARRLVLRALLATDGAAAAPADLGPDAPESPDVANAPLALLVALGARDLPALAAACEGLARTAPPRTAAALRRAASRALVAEGLVDEARRIADRALGVDPSDPLAADACVTAWAAAPIEHGAVDAAYPRLRAASAMLWPDARRAELLGALAARANAPAESIAFCRQWLGLRPADPAPLRGYLSALIAAGEGAALCEAVGWLPSAPYSASLLCETLSTALTALGDEPSLLMAAARGLFDALGAAHAGLRASLLDAANSAEEHLFAAEVLERGLSCDGTAAPPEAHVELANLWRLAGGVQGAEGEVCALAAAVRGGVTVSDLAERLACLAPHAPGMSTDAELLWLRLRAEHAPDDATAAEEGRRLGAALWDLANDRPGAVVAWVNAARRAPLRGYPTLRRDLVAFAGNAEALECLVALGEHEPDGARAASLFAEAARVAQSVEQFPRALELAARALEQNPRQTEVLAAAEAGASPSDDERLSTLYARAARGALGRFGRRAAHFRAARFFEGRASDALAIRHATQAFLAVPTQGAALQMLARVGARSGDAVAVFHAVEQLTGQLGSATQRAGWLVIAADLGDPTRGNAERIDALVRAFVLVPDAETLARLAGAVRRELAAAPGEVEGVTLRFVRAAGAVLPKCEGPEGARVAVRLTELAIELVHEPKLAWKALVCAFTCDGDIDEYRGLVRLAAALLAAEDAKERFAEAVAITERPYASLGWAACGFLGVLARDLGEPDRARKLLISAVSRDSDDDLYVVLADEALAAVEEPSDRKKLERAVKAPRLSEALVAVAATDRAAGDVLSERRRLTRLVAVGSEEQVKAAQRRLVDLAPPDVDAPAEAELTAAPPSVSPASVALVRERIGVDDLAGALAAAGGSRHDALLQVADAAEAAGHHAIAERALEALADTAPTLEGQVEALRRLGRSFDAHDPERSAGYWRRVAAVRPLDEEADLALEDLLLRAGQVAEVAEHLGRRVARFQGDPARREALHALRLRRAALLEQRLGRPEEARRELEGLLAEEPSSKSALRYLADLTARTGDHDATLAVLERLRDLDADDLGGRAEVEVRMARIHLEGGRPDLARALVESALAGRESAEALQLRVEIARVSPAAEELGAALQALARGSADDAHTRGVLLVEAARLAVAAGDLELGLQRAQEAARVAPGLAGAVVLARSLEYRSRGIAGVEGAIAVLADLATSSRELSEGERVVRAFLVAAATRVAHGAARAIASLEAMVADLGPHALLSFALAEGYAAEGRFDAALAAYDGALQGPLHGLHELGEVAILASAAAEAAGDVARAMRYVDLAVAAPSTRVAALERGRRLASKVGDVERERSLLRELVATLDGAAKLDAARELAHALLASASATDHEEAMALSATLPEASPGSKELRARIEELLGEGDRSTAPAPAPVMLALQRAGAAVLSATLASAGSEPPPSGANARRPPGRYAPPVDDASLSPEAIEAFLSGGRHASVGPPAPDPFPQDTVRDPFGSAASRDPFGPSRSAPLPGAPDPDAASAKPAPPRATAVAASASASPRVEALPSIPVEVLRAVEKGTLPDARGDAALEKAHACLAEGRQDAAEPLLASAAGAGSAIAADLLAGLLEEDPRRRTLAIKARRLAAELSPGDPRRLAALRRAAMADQNANHERALAHLEACLKGDAVAAPPELHVQAEQPGMLEVLTRPSRTGAGEAFRLVWEHAAPTLVRHAAVTSDGLRRLLPGEPSLSGVLFSEVVRLLGLRKAALYRGQGAGGPSARSLLLAPPAGLLDGRVTDVSPELPFLLGAALGASQPPQVVLLGQPLESARSLFRAMLGAFGPSVGALSIDRHTAELGEALWQTLPARAQRRLTDLLAQATLASFDEVYASARLASLRVGLFVSGDFRQAVRAVLVMVGQDPRLADSPGAVMDLTSELPALADLYRLALRIEYADARFFLPGRGGGQSTP
ncbi:MAG TPA: hypothetical protein PK141_09985 [Polyangiaceae bacterium]|nr:hypothetical protein [Polyangiaceae bacterium]